MQTAYAVRASLFNAIHFLNTLPTYETERERCVWMWHLSLTTITWDAGEVAIEAAGKSPSLRAARALNRMLLEYAARVHFYMARPDLAELHTGEATNMLRRVMKPVASSSSSRPGLESVRQLVNSGTTAANQPRTRDMLAAMVSHFISDEDKRTDFVEYLDSEFALGNGYVHGSQTSFFDIFDVSTGSGVVHPRTRVLYRKAEVLRCINCMLALLAGLEQYYGQSFNVAEHVATLRALGPYDRMTSIGRHDTLLIMLGISIEPGDPLA